MQLGQPEKLECDIWVKYKWEFSVQVFFFTFLVVLGLDLWPLLLLGVRYSTM
jgi:hypothetical protein